MINNQNRPMKQFMIEIQLPYVMSDEFTSLIPHQRAVVHSMMRKGIITSYSLSFDKSQLWVIMDATSEINVIEVIAEFPSTLFEVYMYAPASPMISFSMAINLPSFVAPHFARKTTACRLPCPIIDSCRDQTIFTGLCNFHVASANTICTDMSSRPPNAPPMAG